MARTPGPRSRAPRRTHRRNVAAWTIGYEGRSLSDFVRMLTRAGVRQLIDIRERPQSRKKGFSRKALESALSRRNIAYIHMGSLGSPSAIRHAYRKTGDFARFRRRYLAHLKGARSALSELRRLLARRRSVLLCFERDYSACHRSIVCKGLGAKGFRFEHL